MLKVPGRINHSRFTLSFDSQCLLSITPEPLCLQETLPQREQYLPIITFLSNNSKTISSKLEVLSFYWTYEIYFSNKYMHELIFPQNVCNFKFITLSYTQLFLIISITTTITAVIWN